MRPWRAWDVFRCFFCFGIKSGRIRKQWNQTGATNTSQHIKCENTLRTIGQTWHMGNKMGPDLPKIIKRTQGKFNFYIIWKSDVIWQHIRQPMWHNKWRSVANHWIMKCIWKSYGNQINDIWRLPPAVTWSYCFHMLSEIPELIRVTVATSGYLAQICQTAAQRMWKGIALPPVSPEGHFWHQALAVRKAFSAIPAHGQTRTSIMWFKAYGLSDSSLIWRTWMLCNIPPLYFWAHRHLQVSDRGLK